MNGIQLGGSWGSRVSQARLDEVSKAAFAKEDVPLEMSESIADSLGISDHAGAFKAVQDMVKARTELIVLSRQPVSDKNEHQFAAAFERAVCAVEDVAKHVHDDYKSSFCAIRNSVGNGRIPGGSIVVSDIGSKYTFECHFQPNMKTDKFTLITA